MNEIAPIQENSARTAFARQDLNVRDMKRMGSRLTFSLFVLGAALTSQAQSTYEPYTINTLAGLAGIAGINDGVGSAARFDNPKGVAVDRAGNVYVADTYNDTIRKIAPGAFVTTLAGLAKNPGSADGTASEARFTDPQSVAVDSAGNVFVADQGNHTIRKITSSGVVTTFAGLAGNPGSADGVGSAARFNLPYGVAVDRAGNVYVADTLNDTIRKITPRALVSTLAGLAGSAGSADGSGSAARFYSPTGVATDSVGNVYVADYNNHTIREVTSAGTTTTLAGLALFSGSADGTGSAARFFYPAAVAVDRAANAYVADSFNHTLRKVTPGGVVTTLAGVALSPGRGDGTGSDARLHSPSGIAADIAGNIYVGDSGNETIRFGQPRHRMP